jgi:hypothetical protein
MPKIIMNCYEPKDYQAPDVFTVANQPYSLMCHYVGIEFCEVIKLPWAEVTQDRQGQVQTVNREQRLLADSNTFSTIITTTLGKSLTVQPATRGHKYQR